MMAPVVGFEVGSLVMSWLKKCGINADGVNRVEIVVDVCEPVEIRVHRMLQKGEVDAFHEFLEDLGPRYGRVMERYQLVRREAAKGGANDADNQSCV